MIKKMFFPILACMIALSGCDCSKYDEELYEIDKRLDEIEGTTITSIAEQIAAINTSLADLQRVDAALQTLIDDLEAETADLQRQLDDNAAADAATKQALENEIAGIKTLIEALQAKDAELDRKIADLKAYADSEISATEDWANATFATLTQYEEVQTEIAGIKALIDRYNTEITAAYTRAVADAIADSETSMKAWVNELLADGYYDIAAIDAKLAAIETDLADSDAELKAQIEEQQDKLEAAKTELTTAYEEAIADAIATNNGIINAAIAATVQDAQTALQNQIDAIETQIDGIESRLSALETNFANRIQSLTYIPKYTDGKATIVYDPATGKAEAELDFFVTPKSVIESIKAEHLAVKATYTATRAASLTELTVTGFEADATNGTITVTVSARDLDLQNLIDGKEMAVFLIINDGNNEFVSDYIPLVFDDAITIEAANLTAEDLKTYVAGALNNGVRDFTISGNLTEDQQKAVGTALNDWCGKNPKQGMLWNEAGKGTVSLTLPDVTAIAEYAFRPNRDVEGYALKTVVLPITTVIGENAFDGQMKLQSVTAPNVTEVKEAGFYNCPSLAKIEMPSVKTVGKSAFCFCAKATFSDFPFSNLESAGMHAFANTGIKGHIVIPNITVIESFTFRMCSDLEGLSFPKVTTVGTNAFAYSPNLTSLAFGTALEPVGGQVLHNGNDPLYTSNITLTLVADQKVLTGGDNTSLRSTWTAADGAATVEFGENKTFCGYTFKEIKKYEE